MGGADGMDWQVMDPRVIDPRVIDPLRPLSALVNGGWRRSSRGRIRCTGPHRARSGPS